jgi:hypothetical protein
MAKNDRTGSFTKKRHSDHTTMNVTTARRTPHTLIVQK